MFAKISERGTMQLFSPHSCVARWTYTKTPRVLRILASLSNNATRSLALTFNGTTENTIYVYSLYAKHSIVFGRNYCSGVLPFHYRIYSVGIGITVVVFSFSLDCSIYFWYLESIGKPLFGPDIDPRSGQLWTPIQLINYKLIESANS